jgi:hypothetical protein
MEYNAARALVERWLAGETTLAEERELRELFGDGRRALPRDLEVYRPLFGQVRGAAAEGPRRKLALRTGPSAAEPGAASTPKQRGAAMRMALPRPDVRRRVAAAAAVVAVAVAVGVVATRTERPNVAADEISCVVDGVRVTDPEAIAAHTRAALRLVDENVRRPEQTLSGQLRGVGELLNELSNEQER